MFALQTTFTELVGRYTTDEPTVSRMWEELAALYSGPDRHYHSLSHLGNLQHEIQAIQEQIEDGDMLQFALYYHDAIYDTSRADNEARSAALAIDRLQPIGIPVNRLQRCERHILATKGHAASADSDTNLFTDADLSILGYDWEAYERYLRQIRSEYAAYPDPAYRTGRRSVVEHFLAMPRIFKSLYFFERYETSARSNLKRELSFL